jgi:SAM-dependent methyltransferase
VGSKPFRRYPSTVGAARVGGVALTRTETAANIVDVWERPPDALMLRVAGHANAARFRQAGLRTFEDFERALQQVGRSFTRAERIYEFGCGCGRLTRWIVERAPDSEVLASDIDAEAIAWLERQSPGPVSCDRE